MFLTTFFSCFFSITNCSIIILRFEWKIGKFENVRTSKHYRILIMASKKERNDFDLKEIENYYRTKTFPKRLAEKEEKANFRQTAKRFSIKNGQLHFKDSILVIADKDRQVGIIYGLGHGSGDTSYSKAMSAHLGRIPTYEKIAARFFCSLPEVDGHCHLFGCNDYFNKWSEAKPVKDKTGLTVVTFLYELMKS